MAWSSLRATGSTIILVTAYYLLPLDHSSARTAVVILVGGLLLFTGLVAWQVRSILRSRYPALRAIEALATSVPLYLLLFAGVYVAMANLSIRSFGIHLTHTDGLYFAVTVFSTVGFGDIKAKTEVARLVVTVQMIADLLVIGLAIRVILGAVTRSRQQQPQDASTG
jgi:voltage-gated potassium channel